VIALWSLSCRQLILTWRSSFDYIADLFVTSDDTIMTITTHAEIMISVIKDGRLRVVTKYGFLKTLRLVLGLAFGPNRELWVCGEPRVVGDNKIYLMTKIGSLNKLVAPHHS
jgi:hypothetical protein